MLKFAFVLLVGLLPAISTYAAFLKFDQYPGPIPASHLNAWNSTARISFQGGNSCSSTVVSADGYIVTNLHCVIDCIANSDENPQDIFTHVKPVGGFYQYRIMKRRSFQNFKCRNYFIFDKPELANTELELVWTGKGFGYFADERIEQIPENDYRALIESNSDVAILKANGLKSPVSCVPASKHAVLPNEDIVTIGYPDTTMRPDEFNSDGIQSYWSFGKVRRTIEEDPFLKAILTLPSQWFRMRAIFDRPEVILSDVDAYHGSSGSLVINQNGEWIGTLNGGIKVSERTREYASTLIVSSESIRSEVRSDLGPIMADQIFNCPYGQSR